ncbi:MAG: hypothetical protein AB7K36_12515 [Chloroflexota bacterium]
MSQSAASPSALAVDQEPAVAVRTRAPGCAVSREYRMLLAVVGLVYVVVFGGILIWSEGLPFITDANENFSVMWHSRNMAELPFASFYWLTDEAYGLDPASHPYVHTHQGNVPRLFGYLLYILGAHLVEAQIVVTTFTIGTLTVFLLYHVFSQLAGPRFACLAACVFMTDYLFFTQWQVVTYRVWHAFFMFAALACAYGVARSARPGRWLGLTFACFAGLFYYELVFVAFVSIFTGLFAAWLMRGAIRRLFAFWTVQGLGGVTALAILVIQLTAYLGLPGMREDISITFTARNSATDETPVAAFAPNSMHAYFGMMSRLSATDPVFQERLERFYNEHDIVFLWNLVDGRALRTPTYFVGSMFVWVFQIYTPLLVLLVGIVLAGWAVGALLSFVSTERLFPRWKAERRAGVDLGVKQPLLRGRLLFDVQLDGLTVPPAWQHATAFGRMVLTLGPFGLALLFLLITLFRDNAFLGALPSSASFARATGGRALIGCLLAAGFGCVLLTWLVTGHARAFDRLPLVRSWVASVMLWGIAAAIRRHGSYYDQEYAPIWFGQIEGQVPAFLARLAVLLAAGLVVALVYAGDRRLLGERGAASLRRIVPYLVAGFLAYGAIYYLAAGYVLTGYLVRYGPVLVFVTDALIAMVLMIAILAAARPLGSLRQAGRECAAWLDSASVRRPRWQDADGQTAFLGRAAAAMTGTLGAGALLLFMVGYWANVQGYYANQFSPTHFRVLKMLREPPYAGATFVVSTYAAPVAWQAQTWAYFDPVLAQDQVTVKDGEVKVNRELNKYVWLADKDTNPAYLRPDYFVCMTPQHLRGILERITRQKDRVGLCSDMPIVKRALEGPRPYLNHQLVDRDLSEGDSWAIVKLDWSVPPGLRLVSDDASAEQNQHAAKIAATDGESLVVDSATAGAAQHEVVPR